MSRSLAERITQSLAGLAEAYHRLLLVVAPAGASKTAALREVANQMGAPLFNLNLVVSERLLELTIRQRQLGLPHVLDDAVGTGNDVVLLDNIEILFDVGLQQDPLRLLQRLSRSRTVVAAWSGGVQGGYLTYAEPGHLEYRRYPASDLVMISPDVP